MSCAVHAAESDTIPCARCGTAYCDDCLVLLRNERLCAECKENVLREVVSGTQEQIRLARVQARAAAYIIDRAMYYALMIGCLRLLVELGFLDRIVIGAFFVLNAAYLTYEAVMLAKRGQTLGKMAMKVRVGRRDGTPIMWAQAWARATIRTTFIIAWFVFTLLPFQSRYFEVTTAIFWLGLLDPIIAAFTRQRTAIHDLLARTRVYRAE